MCLHNGLLYFKIWKIEDCYTKMIFYASNEKYLRLVKHLGGQYPSMTRFQQSKNERYRVIDLVTAIILNIGFRVCKWTGVPEKRVQSFAFYMGDAQPKHAEKGVGWGETPHASSSHGIGGTGGKWRGEMPMYHYLYWCFSIKYIIYWRYG